MRYLIVTTILASFTALVSAGTVQVAQCCRVGAPAPAFTVRTLDGAVLRSSTLRGQPVVLNFWATWCVDCVEEMPAFQKASHRYRKRGVRMIGMVVDEPRADAMRRVLADTEVRYPQYLVSDDVAEEYNVQIGMPVTVFVDRNGIVREIHRGCMTPKELTHSIGALLR